ARWFLSARCDGTLSERQRVRLDEHLEECAECRREAFYFSEIGVIIPRMEKVDARPDFNLRLRAAIKREEAKATEPRKWYQWNLTPAWRLAVGAAMVVMVFAVSYGSYQFVSPSSAEAPITVVPAPETAAHAAASERVFEVSETADEGSGYAGGWAEVDLMTPDGLAARDRYLAARRGPGEYVLETFQLADPTAKKPSPNYLITTVPSEQVIQRTSY
ncbi:MAG: hypothetical protein GF341_04185, partial [candidate division Zixibacteria bacterium]|nr:hypothetical protein [candidate division Zixibacteria bacterium]